MTFATIDTIMEGLISDPLKYDVFNSMSGNGVIFTYNESSFVISGFITGNNDHIIKIEHSSLNTSNQIIVTEVQYLTYKLLLETLKEKLREISENIIDNMFMDEDIVK
jgi:hypothetical protein